MIDFDIEATEINPLDPVQFRNAELVWAKKQMEYARFERKQRRQRNDLVWIVHIGKTYKVTQRGQLRYNKDRDFYTSRDAALKDANNRLVERLALEDAKNPTNAWIREVLWRDATTE